jgi:hypothetical protein
MRLIGLLLVVGIIGFFWSRRNASVSPTTDVDEVMATPVAQPALVSPGSTPPPKESSGLRRPIDRTRNVLDQVKSRNGAGEFYFAAVGISRSLIA